MNAYKVKLVVFEGPLDLLMHLIEKSQINIYDIPIAIITKQYLDYLEQMQEFNVEIASDFLLMAATLLQIKSRILLPRVVRTESQEEEDPRQELVDKLIEYRKFKEVSSQLETLADKHSQYLFRKPEKGVLQYLPPEDLSVELLLTAFTTLWEAGIEEFAIVKREEFTVQDKMKEVILLLRKSSGEIEFNDVITRAGTKDEIITTFLALLELIKLKKILIKQEYQFANIRILLREVGIN